MPTFLDFHSIGRFTEDDLKKGQNESRGEYGVKVLNTFYDMESGMFFCLVDASDRDSVEEHHSKYGIKCGWITQVKMTAGYDKSSDDEED
jgi:hypothetical protein